MIDATCSPTSVSLSYLDQALEFRHSGQLGPAKMACLRALQADDKNPQALLLLGDLELQAGNHGHAEIHIRSALAITPDNVDAYERLGTVLTALDRVEEAKVSFSKIAQIDPGFSERKNQLGLDLQAEGKLGKAISHYKMAISAAPDYSKPHYNLGIVLAQTGQLDAAIDSYQAALKIDPHYPKAYSNLGVVFKLQGRMDEAVDCYEKAIEYEPDFAIAHNNLGSAHKDMGQFERAEACFRRAIALEPNMAEAYRQLTELKTFTSIDADVEAMQDKFDNSNVRADHKALYAFGLAKVMEDLKDYDQAFDYLQSGNRLKRQSIDFSIETERQSFENIKNLFTKSLFEKIDAPGIADASPIFILGMPRSGTTLVEQILSSHAEVYGAGELDALRRTVSAHFNEVNSDILLGRSGSDDPDRFSKAGATYLQKRDAFIDQITKTHIGPFVTDKLPDNFRLIGIIKLILPNAKIIHCSRHPMATCLSIYKRLFAVDGLQFSYDLRELGQYYKMYQSLMVHWHEVLPGFVYDIKYEDLIADQESQSRALIAHCGLQWDPQCLNFHTSSRAVRTASATQVRKPIYQQSLALWQKYEAHLGPLKEALS